MITYIDKLSFEKLRSVFINYLHLVYCAKHHLIERFTEIEDDANFNDLKLAIDETIDDTRNQLLRIEAIYILMDVEPNLTSCDSFINLAEDAFYKIQKHSMEPQVRDMYLLFYMQNVENLEMASWQVLEIIANKLKMEPVRAMLRECFDEAKADRALLLSIMRKLIAG
ncbi:DUF892 family protein [Mucilaginibacter litoreus]|uniref:DUF892 family protein n=1 Tax=Mucilaginibacter litoreus TaxID=1048221 RepID=A0ABW3ALW7_9SPHI